jgi:hypothetical protein
MNAAGTGDRTISINDTGRERLDLGTCDSLDATQHFAYSLQICVELHLGINLPSSLAKLLGPRNNFHVTCVYTMPPTRSSSAEHTLSYLQSVMVVVGIATNT